MYIFLKLNIIIILLNYHYYYKSYLVNYEHLYTLRQRAEYISHMWGSTFNWGAALLHLRLNHRSYVWKEVISDMVFVPAQKLPVLHKYYSGTQLIRSPIGQKNLAVLTRVFFTRKSMAGFARRPKKSSRNNEVASLYYYYL